MMGGVFQRSLASWVFMIDSAGMHSDSTHSCTALIFSIATGRSFLKTQAGYLLKGG